MASLHDTGEFSFPPVAWREAHESEEGAVPNTYNGVDFLGLHGCGDAWACKPIPPRCTMADAFRAAKRFRITPENDCFVKTV